MQLRYCCITAAAATDVDTKLTFVPQSPALNIGPLTSEHAAAAAPAAAAARALAVIATIFGTHYAAAYSSPVVPAVAVTPVAYATNCLSCSMLLSLPVQLLHLLQQVLPPPPLAPTKGPTSSFSTPTASAPSSFSDPTLIPPSSFSTPNTLNSRHRS